MFYYNRGNILEEVATVSGKLATSGEQLPVFGETTQKNKIQ